MQHTARIIVVVAIVIAILLGLIVGRLAGGGSTVIPTAIITGASASPTAFISPPASTP